MRRIKLFCGSGSKELTEQVCSHLGISMGKVKLENFFDGEFQPQYEENLRGRDVYIIQSCNPPFDNYWELFQMIQAAKLASAHRIIVILPYFGYARQDRKDKPRVPIASKLIAKFLEKSGATRVVTLDLHADQIQGFFDIPVDQLFGTYVFWPQIDKLIKDGILTTNLQFASPDNGGVKRMTRYADKFDTDYVICSKIRKKKNEISSMTLIGDVTGRDVILIDDMGDTLKTICTAADLMMEKGAKSVRACLTHPILSGKAFETLEKSKMTEIFVLDTIPLKKTSSKITVLSCSEMLAKAIKKIDNNKSLSSLFLK
jgi:ribose-phosphate pyrophosphokinase